MFLERNLSEFHNKINNANTENANTQASNAGLSLNKTMETHQKQSMEELKKISVVDFITS
jgi:hypothetical protein